MSTNLDEHGQPLRRYPPHYAAAAIALTAAIAVQLGWLEIWNRPAVDRWWPLDLALLLAATVYLLALAELHLRVAAWHPTEIISRLWLLGRVLAANLMIAIFVGIVLYRGAAAHVALAGLWIVPPTVLAAVTVSALTSAFAVGNGWRSCFTDTAPSPSPAHTPRSGLFHGISAVGLVLAIYAIERVEPRDSAPESRVARGYFSSTRSYAPFCASAFTSTASGEVAASL
jgi:hypothetical protein